MRVACSLIVALMTLTRLAAGQKPAVGAELTPDEQRIAREVASPAIRALVAQGPAFLVAVERFRDKDAEAADSNARFAIVTHYRYAGDMAILTLVDLARRTVVRTDTVAHRSTPLAPEELARARQLALQDTTVRKALGARADQVVVEALVLRMASARDPLFGHRVVRLMFRVGPDYLHEPIVLVDLHTATVTIEPAERAP